MTKSRESITPNGMDDVSIFERGTSKADRTENQKGSDILPEENIEQSVNDERE